MQTLEELKAENAAKELEQQPVEAVEQPEIVEHELEAADQDTDTEAQGEEVEDWLKGDSAQAVPLAKHVELKHKLKARLSEKDDELAQIKAELAQLKAGGVMNQQPTQQQPALKVPKLSDYDYDEDKYAEAMADYSAQLVESKLSSFTARGNQENQQRIAQQQREKALDSHYERAEQLIKSTGGKLTAETYQAAELNFRQQLNQVTGNGDSVADEIIARLGDGSAKVVAHLGVNSSAMSALKERLLDDPTGLKAAVYLGQLEAKFQSAQTGKLSKAPAPESSVKASAPVGTATMESLKKAYKSARERGDTQKAFDLARQAKASGYDSKQW
jgi:hypothetical protein